MASIMAARAGKDIYCEKPLARTIREGRAVVNAVRRYGRVFQTGSQERSNRNCRFACELVHNKRIGTLHTIEVNLPVGHRPCPNYAAAPVPEDFDYDRWLGPAPFEPYTPRRCHGSFRFIRDYAAGELTDRGAHVLDLAHWGGGFDRTGPVEIEGSGWYPPDGLFNTFMRFRFQMKYANGVRLICQSKPPRGVKFTGDRGWVFIAIHGGHLSAEPAGLLREKIGKNDIHLHESIGGHKEDFLRAIRTRGDVVAPVHAGHRTNSACALGEIAMLLGRKLRWDPTAERFADDESANGMVGRPMRSPWKL
jgi:predicted dehydrogenase